MYRSLKSKFISVLTVGAGVVVFSVAGFAQDDKAATTTTTPQKAERQFKGDHQKGAGREFGKRQFGGREGFAGRRQGQGGPGDKHRGGMAQMFRGLNLTDAQKTQIQGIMQANKPSAEIRQELRTLMMAKRSGLATAAQEERLTAIKAQAKTKGQGIHEQMLAVLTAEQKAQLETRKTEMKQHMQERKQQFEQRKQNRTPNAPATTDKPKDN